MKTKRVKTDWREHNASIAEKANRVFLPLTVPHEFHEPWQRWCAYRTGRAVDARTASTAIAWTVAAAEACIRSCEQHSDRLGWDRVIGQIDEAIAGQWQGLNLERIPNPSRFANSHPNAEPQRASFKL